MAGYKYTPKSVPPKKKTTSNTTTIGKSQQAKKTKQNNNTSDKFHSNLRLIKKTVFITATFMLFILLIGSKITGSILLNAEDRELAKATDFPDLDKFEANKQFYFCQTQLNSEAGQLSQYQLELQSKTTTMEICIQDKNSLTTNYDTCQTNLNTWSTRFTTCNSSLTTTSNELEMSNENYKNAKQDFSDLELETYSLKINYADDYCCVRRTVLADADIKYYKFNNNNVVCTKDSDDTEFNWENC